MLYYFKMTVKFQQYYYFRNINSCLHANCKVKI